MAIAMSCEVIESATGYVMAGVPSIDLALNAKEGEECWGRLHDDQWYFVKDHPAHLIFARNKGWNLKRVYMRRYGK